MIHYPLDGFARKKRNETWYMQAACAEDANLPEQELHLYMETIYAGTDRHKSHVR